MIETNKQSIIYLSFLLNTNNSLIHKTRDPLFAAIENNISDDIHIFIENNKQLIIKNSKEIVSELNKVLWRLKICIAFSVFAVITIPFLVYAFFSAHLTFVPALTILVVMIVISLNIKDYLNRMRPEINELRENITPAISVLKNNHYQSTIATNSSGTDAIRKEGFQETIRSNFFSKKVSNSADTISNDVALEYQSLIANRT